MVANRAGNVRLRSKAYSDLGFAYRQMGEPLQAKQAFEQSLQVMPNQPMLMVMLGLIAQKNGDLAEAVRQYTTPRRCSTPTLSTCCWRRRCGKKDAWMRPTSPSSARRVSRPI